MRKRLIVAAFAAAALVVLVGSALAGNAVRSSVIYDSTAANGAPTNLVSYGPAAYSFTTIGDKIDLAGTARSLNSVTVTLSSWACQTGSWNAKDCVTQAGATFSQQMTLNIYDPADLTTPIATSTQTFDVPYRPSASPKCTGDNAGKWYTSAKECKNGLADDVTFNFSHVTIPNTVVYAISYNTGGPADSLNVAITGAPSVGTSTDTNIWIDGAANSGFGNYTPVVQFKAGNGS
jgi:hypothetical protein